MSDIPQQSLPPASRGPLAYTLPAGACDTHSHVFGPPETYPLAAGRGYTPSIVTIENYLDVMNAYGIDRAVLVQPSVYGFDNSALLDALARAPDRLRGVAVISPDEPDAVYDKAHQSGVRGIRVNSRNPAGLTLKDFSTVAARVRPRGWHVQLQMTCDEVLANAAAILASPVPVVLDHFAFVELRSATERSSLAALLTSAREDMLFLKLSAPYRIETLPHGSLAAFARELADMAPERLLWGLDWPHTECFSAMPDDTWLIDIVKDWLPMSLIRHQVLVANPHRLYWKD